MIYPMKCNTMAKGIVLFISLFLLGCGENTSKPSMEQMDPKAKADFELQAQKLIGAYASALQGELKTAIQNGGFEKAIEVCQIQAPKIEKVTAASSPLSIRRVSLKTRNPKASPSANERQILENFDKQHQNGTPMAELKHTEASADRWLYMKAIGTKGICLNCHGQNVAPTITAKLQELYPNDRATGYALGELRGAFVVEKLP